MKKNPKVTVIVVAYNAERFIERCLESVLNQDYKNLELIIVDNGSQDKTPNLIEKFTFAKVIKYKRNIGVCIPRNRVIKTTNSKYIITLDSDAVLEKDFISRLIENAERSSSYIGMWGGTVLNMKNPHLIDTLGIIVTKFYRFYDCGQRKRKDKFSPDLSRVIGPCACAAMYKRKMLEEIRESDSEYFDSRMYYLIEDFDIALRAKIKGWGFEYIPDAFAYHYRHGSDIDSKYIQYLTFRNRYYLVLKHLKQSKNFFLILSLLFYDLPRLFVLLLTNYSYTKKGIKEVIEYGKRGNYTQYQ